MDEFVDNINVRVETLTRHLLDKSMMFATAESCTGGMLSTAITERPGSSSVFDRGFVTYSNQAKQDMLGVPGDILATHGAVSGPCAQAMAAGALQNSTAHIAVSITGIAGPDGGSVEKPVGLVYIGTCLQGQTPHAEECRFSGDRTAIRLAACIKALDLLIEAVKAV